MSGIGATEIALLIVFFVVIPAVGIAFFGLVTMLLWRLVRSHVSRDDGPFVG